ncbi:hypothetical protein ACFVEN_44295 [Streptomyces sp. NPDC057681]|uniref:hypothetical protein n=1 Tax=Streptomyces sp. NPDC057681 TaxID=3346209 RepID=UPI0036A1977A
MRITITVDQPTGDFQERLLSLVAEYAAQVETDTQWTIERASRYYSALPQRAQKILTEAVARDGYVPADELRDEGSGSLRGHSAALKQALERGARSGWWPEGMQAPIQPQGPGFGKVVGYRMPEQLVDTFLAAIHGVNSSQRSALESAVVTDGGRWEPSRVVGVLSAAGHRIDLKRARALLRQLAETGMLTKAHQTAAIYDTTEK